MSDADALLDLAYGNIAELDRAIERAEAIVQAPSRLSELKAARARHDARIAADAKERTDLTRTLEAQRDHYRATFNQILDHLDQTPWGDALPIVEQGYTTSRQWFALTTGLCGALGERCRERWDGSDQLELHAPRAWAAYWASLGARPRPLSPEQMPWTKDLARLRALMALRPPQAGRVGNGG